jgi:hypothetical protein
VKSNAPLRIMRSANRPFCFTTMALAPRRFPDWVWVRRRGNHTGFAARLHPVILSVYIMANFRPLRMLPIPLSRCEIFPTVSLDVGTFKRSPASSPHCTPQDQQSRGAYPEGGYSHGLVQLTQPVCATWSPPSLKRAPAGSFIETLCGQKAGVASVTGRTESLR